MRIMIYEPSEYVELTARYARLTDRKCPEGERIAGDLYRMSRPLYPGAISRYGSALDAHDREEVFNSAFELALRLYDPSHGTPWVSYFHGAVRKIASRLLKDTRFEREIVKKTLPDPTDGDTEDTIRTEKIPDPNGSTYETVRHEIERMDRFANIMESLPPVMAWAIRNRMRGVSVRALGRVSGVTGEAIRKQMDRYVQYFPNAEQCSVDQDLTPDSACPWVQCDACQKQLKITAHRGLCTVCSKW